MERQGGREKMCTSLKTLSCCATLVDSDGWRRRGVGWLWDGVMIEYFGSGCKVVAVCKAYP